MGGACGCYSVRDKFSTTVRLSTEPTTERAEYAALLVQKVNSILIESCAAEKSTSQPLGESRSKRFRVLAFAVRTPASRLFIPAGHELQSIAHGEDYPYWQLENRSIRSYALPPATHVI
jgi:hypothetical protein